mmetsp:Transcript_1478/g.4292  ORF Transcript_1478/g.4292 Transcript_1478/m.4292 type:complete len:275 (+) Transcript_1478:2104-2928(+)
MEQRRRKRAEHDGADHQDASEDVALSAQPLRVRLDVVTAAQVGQSLRVPARLGLGAVPLQAAAYGRRQTADGVRRRPRRRRPRALRLGGRRGALGHDLLGPLLLVRPGRRGLVGRVQRRARGALRRRGPGRGVLRGRGTRVPDAETGLPRAAAEGADAERVSVVLPAPRHVRRDGGPALGPADAARRRRGRRRTGKRRASTRARGLRRGRREPGRASGGAGPGARPRTWRRRAAGTRGRAGREFNDADAGESPDRRGVCLTRALRRAVGGRDRR